MSKQKATKLAIALTIILGSGPALAEQAPTSCVDTIPSSPEDCEKKVRQCCKITEKPSFIPICINAVSAVSPQRTDNGPTIIRPNEEIVVWVRTNEGITAHVGMKGESGYSTPSTYGSQPSKAVIQEGAQEKQTYAQLCSSFAPRLPGNATITLKLGNVDTDNGKENIGEEFDFDLSVQTSYSGALRIGIGAVLAPHDTHFAARKIPGSDVSEIVNNGYSCVDMELVIGYTPFLQAFSKNGGRVYYGPDSVRWWGKFAPYIGLGVLATSTNGKVDWLKTFYLGLEYEFFPSFSIAATYVLRRVDELASGLKVGGSVVDTTTLTTSKYTSGFAFVLNITPDFLKFTSSLPFPK